jgi:hypothetical protein
MNETTTHTMNKTQYMIGQVLRTLVTFGLFVAVYLLALNPILRQLNSNATVHPFTLVFSAILCTSFVFIIYKAYRSRAHFQIVLPDWALFLLDGIYDNLLLRNVTHWDGNGRDTIWNMTLYGSHFDPIRLQGQNLGYDLTIRHYKNVWSKLIIEMALTLEEENTFSTYRIKSGYYNFNSIDVMLSQDRDGETIHACARIKPLRELHVSKHPYIDGLMCLSMFGVIDFRTTNAAPAPSLST